MKTPNLRCAMCSVQFPVAFRTFLALTASLILLSSCSGTDSESPAPDTLHAIKVGGKELKVEVVSTLEKRAAGLSFRKSIPPDQGMLFVYPDDEYQSFWMKNTFVPLSIAFIKSDGWISQIEDMEAETLQTHRSKIRVKYVLEVPRGWFVRHGIKVGDAAEIPPELSKASE